MIKAPRVHQAKNSPSQVKPKPYQPTLSLLASAIALSLLVVPGQSQAATIYVDATCSLVDAITAANTDSITNTCEAGSGADTITLSSNSTHTLTAVDSTVDGPNGLPSISSNITIRSNNGGATIERDGSAPPFRVLHVASSGTLSLAQLHLKGGLLINSGGAGIFSLGNLSLDKVTISGNTSSGKGGGIYIKTGSLLIKNSTLSGNSTANDGGAISSRFSAPVTITLNNSTISGNTAGDDGGGLDPNGGSMILRNTTVTNNSAGDDGGGIDPDSGVILKLYNSIVANNPGGNSAKDDCFLNTTASISANAYNIIKGGNCITDALAVDPALGPLAHNGSITETHALLTGSAAIDAGDDMICSAAPINGLDQRGDQRNVGTACDMGAMEFDQPIMVSGACGLIEAIDAANTDTATANCPAGNGHDKLVLTSGSIHDFTVSNNTANGYNALPSVTTAITIEGNNASISRSGSHPMRLFHVASTGSLFLQELTITNGLSESLGTYGGAIFSSGALLISNSILSGNTAGSTGGAISSILSKLDISNSQLIDNAGLFGGAISTKNSILRLYNSNLSGNTAAIGGALSLNGSSNISHSKLANNRATGYSKGGAIYNLGGPLNLGNSTLSANSGDTGGAIFNRFGEIHLSNSTLSGNSAVAGGAIFTEEGLMHINNSTLSDNTADSLGGALFIRQSTVNLHNSAFANSLGRPDCEISVADGGTINADNHNLIEDGSCGTAALTGDPKLGLLQNNGGPTKTHGIQKNSPLLDAGDDALCAASPINNLDQRGIARPDGIHCDIGAYEGVLEDGSFFVIPTPGGKAVIFSL